LMVWGTDTEFERVNELLTQLGEVPSGQHDPRVVRIIEPSDTKSTPQLLKQLQEAWSTSGGNQLIIKGAPETSPAPKAKENEEKENPKSDVPAKPASDRSAASVPPIRVTARFVDLVASGSNTPKPEPANEPSKVADPPAAAASVSQPAAPAPVTITV